AYAMIIPVGALSAVQIFVLTMIVVGSNAGTFLWTAVGSWISEGVTVTATVPVMGMDSSKKILKTLVCAENVYLYESRNGNASIPVAKIRFDSGAPQIIYGPVNSANFSLPANATKVVFGSEKSHCGTLSLSSIGRRTGEDYKEYHS